MWRPLELKAPARAAALSAALAEGAAACNAVAEAGGRALVGLGLPGGTGGQVAERAELDAWLFSGVGFLAVTPYDLGERKGDQAYLTPSQALTLLQERLTGLGTLPEAALLLLLPGLDPALLANSLAGLCRAWPQPELEKLLRRSGALATLESHKFVIPQGADVPAYPSGRQDMPASYGKGLQGYLAYGGQAVAAEAAQRAADAPATKLRAFAQRRLARDQAQKATLREWAAGLQGQFPFFAACLEGVVAMRQLATLGKSAPVPDIFKSSAVLCWHGHPAALEFLKDLFGVWA